MTPPRRIAVVGGGITGLTAALRLAEGARRDAQLSVVLLEATDRLGGKIATESVDGFLVEGGPDTFLARKPEGIALCRELGIAHELIPTDPTRRRSFVRRGRKLYALPEGMSGLVPAKLGPLFLSGVLSPAGKVRAAAEPFIPKRTTDEDESVASFVRRRLGAETYERLVEPLVCGIHAGDGEQLSVQAVAGTLRDMEDEYGSVLKGLRRSGKAPPDVEKFPTPFVALRGGMQTLVDAIVAHSTTIERRTRARVQSITRHGDAFAIALDGSEVVEAAAVIVTTPAYAAADMLSEIDADLATGLRGIPFVSNAAVSMGFTPGAVQHPLHGYGYVVPRREGRRALACSWGSSKLPGRAPEGSALVRVFLGRAGDEIDARVDDQALIALALDEIRDILHVRGNPLFTRVFRYNRSMPQYTLGHLERVEQIERRLAGHPGLQVVGNAFRGVGIPDCIRAGQKAAFQALRHLETLFVE